MDVGFTGAAGENPDPDLLFQGMVDEQNRLNTEYKTKLQGIVNFQKVALNLYMSVHHPGMVGAVLDPPANCEFLTRSLEETATFYLEWDDHCKDIKELRKLWEGFNSKLDDFSKLKLRGQGLADSVTGTDVISFDEEKAMLEELRNDWGLINQKMLNVANNNLKFILICEKAMALDKRTFDEDGNPREVDNSVLEVLRKGMIFVNQTFCQAILRQLKKAALFMKEFQEKKVPSAKNRLDLFTKDLEERGKNNSAFEEEPNEEEDECTPVKRMRL